MIDSFFTLPAFLVVSGFLWWGVFLHGWFGPSEPPDDLWQEFCKWHKTQNMHGCSSFAGSLKDKFNDHLACVGLIEKYKGGTTSYAIVKMYRKKGHYVSYDVTGLEMYRVFPSSKDKSG